MDRLLMGIAAAATLALAGQTAPAQTPPASRPPVAVTPDNFVRAESDRYFASSVQRAGLGRLEHNRNPMPIDAQTVIRANRDTLYSSGVFNLDAGPVTIALPDPGNRFLS